MGEAAQAELHLEAACGTLHPHDALPKLTSLLARCLELDALSGHVRSFGQILTQLRGEPLPERIATVRAGDLPSMHTLITGLGRGLAAVTSNLTLPWNSGVAEGHVNRIKMIKR